MAYLPSWISQKLPESNNELLNEFVKIYTTKNDFKLIRNILQNKAQKEHKTWDIVRNRQLKKLNCSDLKLFDEAGAPNKRTFGTYLLGLQSKISPGNLL